MAEEMRERRTLPGELRYRVVGTGPRAEAQHGRYVRSVLRYLRANQPVQWLIATETITKPAATAEGGENACTSASTDSDSPSTTDSSSTGTSQPDPLRRQLFPNDDSAFAQAGEINTTAAAETAGDGTQAPDEQTIVHGATEGASIGSPLAATTLPLAHGDARSASAAEAADEFLSKTQLAARRSSRRTQSRDPMGRFVKEEPPGPAAETSG